MPFSFKNLLQQIGGTVQHSEVLSYFQKVNSINAVRKGYWKMKILYGDVTHIAAAFQLSNATIKKDQMMVNQVLVDLS